jgi:hypothetical protein
LFFIIKAMAKNLVILAIAPDIPFRMANLSFAPKSILIPLSLIPSAFSLQPST